jgi:hypothetical protein
MPGQAMLDLNDLLPANTGWTVVARFDINDTGQITCVGQADGNIRALHFSAENAWPSS